MRTIRDVMNMDVRDLELSVRCSNCMARMNIKKLYQLTAMSKDDISKMRNIGRKSIEEMDGKLAEIGPWWQKAYYDVWLYENRNLKYWNYSQFGYKDFEY